MSQSLSDLESTRSRLLEEFLTLGDFRQGSLSASEHRCGKPNCQCARPDGSQHQQIRLYRKVKGKSVAESFPTPAALAKAIQEVNEFHRFQRLSTELTDINQRICRLRPVASQQTTWTEQEKKRLLQFIRKSHVRSRRSSR